MAGPSTIPGCVRQPRYRNGRKAVDVRKAYLILIPLGLVILFMPIANYVAGRRLPQGRSKLVVWGLQPSEEAAGQRAMVAEFEKRHPGVKVSVLSMGAGQMDPQKLMTAIVGKKPPDVINQDRFTIGDWASRDTFLPLDDLVSRDRDQPYGIRPEHYYKPCWAEATYKGRVFAIPNSTDDRFLYYNRDLFREAGLDPNHPPETWDELLDYAKKLTTYNPDGSFKRAGFIPNYGNSWLYLYSWLNDGEFMSQDGRTCTMDNSYTVQALEFMVKVYDALKGAERLDSFQNAFQSNELDPFLTGKVAMRIEVDQAMAGIARYAPDLDFGVAPAPVPAARRRETYPNFVTAGLDAPRYVPPSEYPRYPRPEKGRFNGKPRYITWSGGFSWAIPRGARHVELAWELIEWMTSPEANLIGAAAQKAYNRSKGRPYVPPMHANIKVNEAVFRRFAPQAPKFRNALALALQMMPYSRYRPVTFVGQQLWDEHVRAWDLATHHRKTSISARQALDQGTRVVQKELDRTSSRARLRPIPTAALVGVVAAALAGVLGAVYWKIRQTGRVGRLMRSEAVAGYLFASPWIIGFLVFMLGPIVVSVVFSFCDYDVLHSARWVGLGNYHELLTDDLPRFSKALYNAGYLAFFGISLGIITGLAIAILLNAKVTGMTWYRTTYYLPSILPVVASAVLWVWVLNPEFGLINSAWKATLGQWFHLKPPGWLAAPEWAKPALIFMGLWGAGGGMILWLAGLQGIPQHLYEAAELDGASAWQRFRHVTVPMLTPYLFFNIIMGTIGALQTFDSVYIMTSGGPVDSTLVPVLYLFRHAFRYFRMGYASAVAWILFAIILALTLIQLKLAPRWVYYEAEKKK